LGQQQHCRLPSWIWETTVEQGFFFNFLKDKLPNILKKIKHKPVNFLLCFVLHP
jgi:hypothetical protein